MTPNDQLLAKLKDWRREDLETFAAKLLIISKGSFHGSITVHFANNTPKKIVFTETRDI